MFEKRLEDFAVTEELVSNLGIFFYMDGSIILKSGGDEEK